MNPDPPSGSVESTPWWREYFDDAFLRLYRPFLTPERTRREVTALLEILQLPTASAVLDLACGWGRHAIELACRGYRVTGVDRSVVLLRQAAADARRAGVDVRWVCGDVRELPQRGSFDAAISVFSSLGYFLSDQEDLRALEEARKVLRPGGVFLIETMHRDDVVRRFLPRDWWEGEEGEQVWVEREFDAVAGVSHEALRWRMPDGAEGEKRHSIRVRSASEWDDLLCRAGFEPLAWYGSWHGSPFTHRSKRLVITARPVQ